MDVQVRPTPVWARVHTVLDWIDAETGGAGGGPSPGPSPPTQAPSPSTCPSATSTGPDSDGDCKCNSGLLCYEDGLRGCTYSVPGQYSIQWFLPSCSGCQCL